MKLSIISALVALLCMTIAASAAQPPMPDIPMMIYGDVTVNGEPAPTGTSIIAYVGGSPAENFTVTAPGEYILTIEGLAADDTGKEVTVSINGIDAGVSEKWASQRVVEKDLSVDSKQTEDEDSEKNTTKKSGSTSKSASTTTTITTTPDSSDTIKGAEESGASSEDISKQPAGEKQSGDVGTTSEPPSTIEEDITNTGAQVASDGTGIYLLVIAVIFIGGILIYAYWGKLSSKRNSK